MKKQILLTCVLVGTFILPANAIARKNDNEGYKPKNSVQKTEKRKQRQANKAGKKRNANKAAKKSNANKRPKVAAKPHYAPPPKAHHHKKKKKNKKLKRFLKKTLKLLAQEAYPYNHHHAKPRRHDTYGYANRNCLPKRKVFRRLRNKGWRHIELINQGPNRARLFATNPYNERYKLVVNKCSGRLIKAKPLYY